jgi:hypothetical protein
MIRRIRDGWLPSLSIQSRPGMDYASGMDDPDAVLAAWSEAETRLPAGWVLDSLRCASTGLDSHDRSTDWIAVAIGPDGEERTFQATDALTALAGLAARF